MNAVRVRQGERGFALVVSMLVLLVLTLLGLVIMASVAMNRGLTGNDQRMRQSLNVAEAGLGEAMARIRYGDAVMDPADPNDVCQIFNTVSGSVPTLGTDSLALATGQPAGSYLNYTTATKGPDVLTISWKKNAAGTAVMRYYPTATPKINAATGLPIYIIKSTGRVGQTRRQVVSEVIQRPYQVNVKGGLASDIPIDFTGTAQICGWDHYPNTPDDDGDYGRNSGPGGPHDCIDNEATTPGLPGAWSTGPITGAGASSSAGSPTGYVGNQTGFYAGPWDALGLGQADWWSWIGAPTVTPSTLNGITHIDNNSTTQDRSASAAFHSVNGEGMLYVDGDLRLNAGFHYRGLIYVEGDLQVNGKAWILGGIIVKGRSNILANGNMTILYSSETIRQMLAKYGGQFVTLGWREN